MKKLFSSLLLLLLLDAAATTTAADLTDSAAYSRPQLLKLLQIAKAKGGAGGGCQYSVEVRTSCSSRAWTRDRVSLAFGDAYGNQVYAPRLDDPPSGTFRRCSTDTFKITGPCTYQICYLYLLRVGPDGWKPEQIKVYKPSSQPITFYYDMFLPNGVWYGFNQCDSASSGAADDDSERSLVAEI